MSDIEKLDLASENQRLRERVAELERTARMFSRWDGALRGMAESEAQERATKAEAERDAALTQVAALREALEMTRDQLTTRGQVFDFAEFREKHALHFIDEALASTPAPTHDYSGLCAAPSCEGHCGYVHARGCEAVREYLADHGGDPYRAPSPPDILRRVAERAMWLTAERLGERMNEVENVRYTMANVDGTAIDTAAIVEEATRG